ncbi:thiamine phosphate synthase [Acetobacter sp.]|uniref:thiamine phosphate synthase n=1 Tax=Acetobacter sp. TaxID=440 RepID=UPI0039EB41BA
MNDTPPDTQEPCLAYLVTPPLGEVIAFLPSLEKALRALPVAAVRLRLADLAPEKLIQLIQPIRDIVQSHDVALILDGLPKLARETGCDGAHVPASTASEARRLLGDELQLGVSCGFSRDDAMHAGENGVDYVAFGPFGTEPNEEGLVLVRWWREMMELPVVAEYCVATGNEMCPSAKQLAQWADFLAVGITPDGEALEEFWREPERFASLFA